MKPIGDVSVESQNLLIESLRNDLGNATKWWQACADDKERFSFVAWVMAVQDNDPAALYVIDRRGPSFELLLRLAMLGWMLTANVNLGLAKVEQPAPDRN
jgi:hypothetical protein